MGTKTEELDRSEAETDSKSVDRAFRRAALIQDAKLSARRRRLGARRRQGTS
jgi:hypothetical protein